MDVARRNEIAYLFLKYKLKREGAHVCPNFRRDVGSTAATIGISFEEALEFVEPVIRELVDETFVKKNP